MRAAVHRLDLASPAPCGRVTISAGVGYVDRVGETTPDALLAAADGALYEAKRGGRNQVAIRVAAHEASR